MIGDYMKEMQVHLKEISNLFKKWNTVLNQPHLVKMTFEELLNYENEVSSTSDNVECSDNSNCKPTILKPKNNYFNAPLIFLACFLFLP
jgi:6-phosphogluconate dehydrogenase